ncbi:phytoene desaturase family protein [Flammeovirga kamogawensis]|uniref:Phytoene desaturase n=1 Tax=Flammeovirga kamogawensis TaxID=373891 RepID=A0ABX8GYC3_9BACT|nr:phytoene desaturase family protein [Flammeovirga kamogawensis]MBB6462811.1 phytoene desaturase [Flammeovirga kamogawensis]QWG08403.1 phytoene desaturase [Flammeovirga kamogawensis]TRX66699.1 phytoene desaturase [Flammeovirga kamogawensis]
MKKAVVIGAGIGGIAAALRVNKLGYKVTVLEGTSILGGKLRQFKTDNGFTFDQGPSLFTLPHLVTELFQLYNKDPKEYFDYTENEIATKYFFSDNTEFIGWSDPDKFGLAVKKQWGVDIHKVLQQIIGDYKKTAPIFLESALTDLSDLLNKDVMKALPVLTRLGIFESLNAFNEKHFKHEQLVQLFNRYATYNGSNPYQTPSIMRVISALEHSDGVFFPKNGMRSIATSLIRLAEEEGINFLTDQKVKSIKTLKNKIVSVETINEMFSADLFVSNADVNFFLPNVIEEKVHVPKTKELSSSALVFYWGINHSFSQLDLHNIFFSEDYNEEFRQLFEEFKIPEDPTIYVHISSKINHTDAPKGGENWFVMINVPAAPEMFSEEVVKKIEEKLISKLSQSLSIDLKSKITYSSHWTPKTIEQDTMSWKGALYGLNSNKLTHALYRQRNKSSKYKNLYFVGGSVHPGGGIPLCLNSAKIVSSLVAKT